MGFSVYSALRRHRQSGIQICQDSNRNATRMGPMPKPQSSPPPKGAAPNAGVQHCFVSRQMDNRLMKTKNKSGSKTSTGNLQACQRHAWLRRDKAFPCRRVTSRQGCKKTLRSLSHPHLETSRLLQLVR